MWFSLHVNSKLCLEQKQLSSIENLENLRGLQLCWFNLAILSWGVSILFQPSSCIFGCCIKLNHEWTFARTPTKNHEYLLLDATCYTFPRGFSNCEIWLDIYKEGDKNSTYLMRCGRCPCLYVSKFDQYYDLLCWDKTSFSFRKFPSESF